MIPFEQLQIRVTSADIEGLLQAMTVQGINASSIAPNGDMAVVLSIGRTHLKHLEKLILRRGDELDIIGHRGLYWQGRNLLKRPVLLVGVCLLLFVTLFLPTRVLFIRVEGNTELPSGYILEAAEQCGIRFGASRRQVRSERMKNQLLDILPELQWAGINTYGCVAVISVRQRSTTAQPTPQHGVSSIVAIRDGVIQSCTVIRGNGQCVPGQAVVKGQVLISGFTDCGLSILAQQAEGEVMALTNRHLTALTPEKCAVRIAQQDPTKKFSLILGKIRINFYKDSGILDTSCVKMYTENYMTLPGGFQLPIALAVQTIYSSQWEEAAANQPQTLTAFAERYLRSQMTAGQILHRQETVEGCRLEGRYGCLEMIGQVRSEESITENEDH